MPLKAPFPYFGGKSRIAPLIWRAFGDVRSYVEPFAGSLAVLLARPQPFSGTETVNDADGLLSNFWRAMTRDVDAVIAAAEWPVNEADLHARHLWLVGQRERITERLMADPYWCDPRAAGWWVWGQSCWIGSGWCSGNGPWVAVDGVFTDSRQTGDAGRGVNRKLPNLGDAGRGVNRQVPDDSSPMTRQRYWLGTLVERLRDVRVCCGDFERVLGGSVTHPNARVAAVFLDPPYSAEGQMGSDLYAVGGDDVSARARHWAIEHGNDPAYRIALAGYGDEHEMLDGWRELQWEQGSCYAKSVGNVENSRRERIWFSPHCRPVDGLSVVHADRQVKLFVGAP